MISRTHWHGCYFSSYKYWTTFVVGSWCSLAYPLASTARSGYRTAYLDETAKGWEESCASQEGNFRIERAKGACREMLFTLFICPTSIGRFIIERRYSTAVITYRYHSLPDGNDGVWNGFRVPDRARKHDPAGISGHHLRTYPPDFHLSRFSVLPLFLLISSLDCS